MKIFLIVILRSFLILTEAKVPNENCRVTYPQIKNHCVCSTYLYNTALINSSILQLNHTVKGNGDVDVNLGGFNLHVNDTYIVILKVYETISNSDRCTKNGTSKILGYDHSQLELKNCFSCENEISTVVVPFDYIFTGCYALQVFRNDIRIAKSNPIYIITNYTKQLIDNVFEVRDNFRQALQNKTIVEVIMASHEITKPSSILTNLQEVNCSDLNNCIDLKSKTKITTKNSQTNEIFLRCTNSSNAVWFCKYTKDADNYITYLCTYWGLNPGRYIFQFELLDEYTRCNLDSIWTTSGCHKSHTLIIPQVTTLKLNHQLQQNDKILVHSAITLVAVALIVVILRLIYLYRKRRLQTPTRSDSNCEEIQAMINLDSSALAYCKNEVLIVYAREADVFTDMLETFKAILLSNKNTTVYDINMCGQYSYLDEDWIRTKISNTNTKVILFLNRCGVILYYNPTIIYVNPRREDKFFRYAIKQLQTTKSRSHKNFFVIGLANYYNDDTISLNLEVRYSMPDNIIDLLKAVFDNRQECDDNYLITNFISKCHECNAFYKMYPYYNKQLLIKY